METCARWIDQWKQTWIKTFPIRLLQICFFKKENSGPQSFHAIFEQMFSKAHSTRPHVFSLKII